MGYFVEDFVNHLVFKERSSDFWEMNLHHCITLTLFGGMILQNFISLGVVVSYLHSLSDISTAGSRVLSQTVYKKPTLILFMFCIISWIFFRNICLPLVCYECWVNSDYPAELAEFYIAPKMLTTLLTVLCFMHVYWLILFLNILIKGIKTGDNENLQSMPAPKKIKESVKIE
jgi:hypothetical protein